MLCEKTDAVEPLKLPRPREGGLSVSLLTTEVLVICPRALHIVRSHLGKTGCLVMELTPGIMPEFMPLLMRGSLRVPSIPRIVPVYRIVSVSL